MGLRSLFTTRILEDRGPEQVSEEYWRSLFYFALYRLALGLVLVTFAISGSRLGGLGNSHPRLFLATAAVYSLFALVSLFTINAGRPAFQTQGRLQYLADLAAITLLMHASGGPASGLGLLLVVAVAGAGVALGGRLAVALAALATVLALGEYALSRWVLGLDRGDPTPVGILGIGLFVTALLVHGLVNRIRRVEAVAAKQSQDLSNLERLNELIIERLHTGVLATDAGGHVRFANATALRLLGLARLPDPAPRLADLAPGLDRWLAAALAGTAPAEMPEVAGRRLVPRPVALEAGPRPPLLLYLDDPEHLERQTQQERLAALGRLSAGLAHEIRNPLGAISHAGQLLGESPHLDGDERRMVEIIGEHCRRVNRLVEDILQLGRRRAPPQALALDRWLGEVAAEFRAAQDLGDHELVLDAPAVTIMANGDQLRQVLFNLLDNARRHGAGPIALRAGEDTAGAWIAVHDQGPGVAAGIRAHLFEPFCTGDRRSTGLGLYIARELCGANDAELEYDADGPGTCFRVRFRSQAPVLEASA